MKILLVDDHALFREGMRYVLQQLPETVEILEEGNFPDALKFVEQTCLAEGAVKIHIATMYQILRVSSRMGAVRVAEKLGLIGVAYG